jgi:hypothetical protein
VGVGVAPLCCLPHPSAAAIFFCKVKRSEGSLVTDRYAREALANPNVPHTHKRNTHRARPPPRSVQVDNHAVTWDRLFEFEAKMTLGPAGMLEPCPLKIAVRRETSGGASHDKVSGLQLARRCSAWPCFFLCLCGFLPAARF